MTPTSDSNIEMELWLPESWNGSFRGAGNAGFAGSIDYLALSEALMQGYAAAATDAGHTDAALSGGWALEHPQKVIDFGYRAVHLMTEASHQIVRGFYGAPAAHSFFSSCSDGGREALMEAQRYPADYDGIVAGDPAYDWTGLMTNAFNNEKQRKLNPLSSISTAQLATISSAVLAACDALDGVRDGIIGDARQCFFDPEVLTCKDKQGTAGANNSCLLPVQVAYLKALYAGSHTRDNEVIFPGYLPGGELGAGGWATWITGGGQLPIPGMTMYEQGYFANMVYDNALWTGDSVTSDEAYQQANAVTSVAVDATNPVLTPFFKRGGKLIMYHGWNDPAVSPLSSISYFNSVSAATKGEGNTSMRLYMVPGMQHCIGGSGPTYFGQLGWFDGEGTDDAHHDVNLAMDEWVKTGKAPEAIIASQYTAAVAGGASAMTRPLCPYPQIAAYRGSGSTNDAANFACTQAPNVAIPPRMPPSGSAIR